MKYWIDADEAYPIFSLRPAERAFEPTEVADVPDELVARYERACKEYYEVQSELAELIKYYDNEFYG